ncbi:MAG: S1 RNA-binding domain-containing protein, partial [Deltaproteobacteria bacterium]|nr:S1 RNA-binding domain-containing protein [Deltaproteobacteria bacterium]
VGFEREALALHQAAFMRNHVGEEFEGEVTGFSELGVEVTLNSPFVTVLIPFNRLGDGGPYELDPLRIAVVEHEKNKRLPLGARVRVQIESVSIEARQTLASLIEAEWLSQKRFRSLSR